MKITMNITATSQDLDRYADGEDLRQFYQEKDLDGLELMPCGCLELPSGLTSGDVVGIHLRYSPCWVDFWNGNREALQKEYGDEDTWTMYYGGKTRDAFLEPWRQELEYAHRIGAKYVVFHVAECTLEECLTYHPRHSDMEVCQAACEMINALMDNTPYQFCFLVENLWWSGLNLMDNAVTKALMDGIHYQNKGIMLDTGHLLNTNRELKTQEEGVQYIGSVLDQMGDLSHYIRGIHLNQSLSGGYVKSVIADPPQLSGTYWERLQKIYPHIYHIDYHEPFIAPGVPPLIRRIHPDFLTLELITSDRAQHDAALNAQIEALKTNGGIR